MLGDREEGYRAEALPGPWAPEEAMEEASSSARSAAAAGDAPLFIFSSAAQWLMKKLRGGTQQEVKPFPLSP